LASLPDRYPARRTKSASGLHTGKANGYERDDQSYFEDRISDWIDSSRRGMWTLVVRVYHRGGIGPSNSGIDGAVAPGNQGSRKKYFADDATFLTKKAEQWIRLRS
jgi:hypothetical protein